ncbi:carboxymuconolactone decarboxylase family protein [Flavobacterium beibuense]|uniref:Carboxymuconolactone decarboxylase n=1 Tax=Flavobacterium beibuense F44-8 TaxID=1406840 RepID=A0A0A2LN51_9FLAO|nr:carboxymuconolactone decarboxylase family protein [Flavobacterium beibuense]KGO80756.1 carboxymuconolactone decarboxylase [Flavobacterium beibuense F44-8]
MEQRTNPFEKRYNALKPLFSFGAYLAKSAIEKELLHLIYFRVSQLNGCAYCLDMHAKDLRELGESEQRLYMLSAWEESPVYSNRERAAFTWAEAVTNLAEGHVKDAVYAYAREEFSEEELIDLTIAIIAINGFNRLNVAFRTPAGNYVPGMHAHHVNNN